MASSFQLPLPKMFKTVQEVDSSDEHEAAVVREHDLSLVSMHVDASVCMHPPGMMDELTNACSACGLYGGKMFAPPSDKSCSLGSHILSSADASAAARKKRREIVSASASENVYVTSHSGKVYVIRKDVADAATATRSASGAVAKKRGPKRRVVDVISGPPSEGSVVANTPRTRWHPVTPPRFSNATQLVVPARDDCDVGHRPTLLPIKFTVHKYRTEAALAEIGSLSAGMPELLRALKLAPEADAGDFFRRSRRAAIIASIAAQLLHSGDAYASIPTTAYAYGAACPCAAVGLRKYDGVAETPASEIDAVVCEVYRTVFDYNEYFNSPQRRRLHHISTLVAILIAHIRIYHDRKNSRTPAAVAEIEDCLELERVRARCKPSQGRYENRSLNAALSDALKISYTCTTRLVQEAFMVEVGNAAGAV
jgi:hypothetical protein